MCKSEELFSLYETLWIVEYNVPFKVKHSFSVTAEGCALLHSSTALKIQVE